LEKRGRAFLKKKSDARRGGTVGETGCFVGIHQADRWRQETTRGTASWASQLQEASLQCVKRKAGRPKRQAGESGERMPLSGSPEKSSDRPMPDSEARIRVRRLMDERTTNMNIDLRNEANQTKRPKGER